ncbi:hypothetical protein KC19_5G027900 [Ceratodon purpureus]|uniref:Uncharacterized protein n=1 Tax=Ceratodon purpureus TaxID=3225 RepID=A0A8T0HXA3_CERPU|nr:hypothetical protein KC19_5G027900 [Ceratodon purpureus]
MPPPGAAGSGRGMGLVSDRPQVARERKQRLKREDHTYVKHDKSFSDWKFLVGPADWKEHASGKIPDRFRVNNLPAYYDGAGIYELGVTPPAWLPPQRNCDAVFLKPQDVVVVYLGCADNVYHHLQRYGQTGAHLEGVRSTRLFTAKNETSNKSDLEKSRSFPSAHSRNTSLDRSTGADGGYMSTRTSNASTGDAIDCDKKMSSSDLIGSRSLRGPCLFSEVFALGCSVAFRWAATESKAAAEKAETELIEVFDYAWKRGGNFRQRSPDILAKIVQAGTLNSDDTSCFGDPSDRSYFFFKKTRVGITIPARKPPEDPTRAPISRTSSSNRSEPPRGTDFFHIFKNNPSKSSEFTKFDIPLDRCGILLENGRQCSALPVKGGKRCLLHKDIKKSTQKRPARVASQLSPSHDSSGVKVSTTNLSKQAGEASPMRTHEPPTTSSSCFPYLQSPAPSASTPGRSKSPEPTKRRGSLSFTSWLRTSELRLARSLEWAEMATPDGGGKRSSSTYSSILTTCEESLESPCRSPCRSPSRREICGLRLDDGTVCPDPPRPDRKRCEAHKGLRNQAPKSPNRNGVPVRAF